jgi:hypothetical protein
MKYLLVFWLALLLVVSLAFALAPSAAMAQTVTPEATSTPVPVSTTTFFTFSVGAPVAVPVDDIFASGVVASEDRTTVSIVFPAGMGYILGAMAVLGVVLVAKWVWSWVVG